MYPLQHSTDVIFWDVDTQYDFMTPDEPGGRAYVKDLNDPEDPGAVTIIPMLERLALFARQNDIMRIATGDWHSMDHPEIDPETPDFRSTFPPHCMADEPGSAKIPETELRSPLILPLGADPAMAWDVVRQAVREGRDIFLRKAQIDCFAGNPASAALIEALAPRAIVIYGVALDSSVKGAIEGMRQRGHHVHIVTDAAKGRGLHEPEALFRNWRSKGAALITAEQILDGSFIAAVRA